MFVHIYNITHIDIIKEPQTIFVPGNTILFPVIISKGYVHYGVPQKDLLLKIFNI